MGQVQGPEMLDKLLYIEALLLVPLSVWNTGSWPAQCSLTPM